MSIFDWLENLRQRPEIERRRILVGATFSITAIIFFIWLSVKLYNTGETPPVTAETNQSPISEINDSVGNFFQYVSAGFDSIKNNLSLLASTSTSTLDIK